MAGLVLGLWASSPISTATAQPAAGKAPPVDISIANAEKIKNATDTLETAQAALQQDGSYVPAVRGLNAFATLAGGVDAVSDLESGRGVDPITFSGLHVGLATDEVTPHLGFDASGRLTYKGKLVRIYSVEQMRRLNTRQAQILDVAAGGTRKFGAPTQ